MNALRILDGHVTHERLDDEVLVINLETGAYYALGGVGADCWTLLSRQAPIDTTSDVLAERYRTDRATVRAEVDALAAELVHEGLATWDEDPSMPADPLALLPGAVAPAYAPPRLEKYDDMEELLLLDPIHEVDDAGWPALPAEPA